jgi:hypothetical protein
MNKTKTLSSLYNIANVLDNSGLYKEANTITNVMKRVAQELDYDNDSDETRPEGVQPYKYNARQSPLRGVNNPEDQRLVQKSHELLTKAKKMFGTEGSIPQAKLQFFDRETIGTDSAPVHLRTPDKRITDFGDNVNSKYKYNALLEYLYEFYQICEANIQVQKHKDDIELATNQYSRTFTKEDSDRRIGRMNDFLNEIQEFISEVKMIASENEDTRI